MLGEAEGSVQSISWQGQFVAWATDLGLRVYDLLNRCSLGLMKWPVQQDRLPKNFRCNLAWTGNTLIVSGFQKHFVEELRLLFVDWLGGHGACLLDP